MDKEFATYAVHSGYVPESATGAVNPPIYASSTFAQDAGGKLRGGYEYSRSANPTRTVLEKALAELELANYGFAFASGLAASDVALRAILNPGDHIIIPDDMYGGSYRLVTKVFQPWNINYTSICLSDLEAIRLAIQPKTKLIWLESPTNPLLNLADIAEIAKICKTHAVLLMVDNTFASPYLQRPLDLGADIVLHSTTKYLSGHSDIVGGALMLNSSELADKIRFLQNSAGAVPSPFDAFLTLRGIRTLAVRMDKHCDNAEKISSYLDQHSQVLKVFYPGLVSHSGHAIAKKQMQRFGGMISFQVKGGEAAAIKVCGSTQLIYLAESLGGVESLIEHPASMTHAATAATPLAVPTNLIRLSIGIEAVNDLITDLDRALSKA